MKAPFVLVTPAERAAPDNITPFGSQTFRNLQNQPQQSKHLFLHLSTSVTLNIVCNARSQRNSWQHKSHPRQQHSPAFSLPKSFMRWLVTLNHRCSRESQITFSQAIKKLNMMFSFIPFSIVPTPSSSKRTFETSIYIRILWPIKFF